MTSLRKSLPLPEMLRDTLPIRADRSEEDRDEDR